MACSHQLVEYVTEIVFQSQNARSGDLQLHYFASQQILLQAVLSRANLRPHGCPALLAHAACSVLPRAPLLARGSSCRSHPRFALQCITIAGAVVAGEGEDNHWNAWNQGVPPQGVVEQFCHHHFWVSFALVAAVVVGVVVEVAWQGAYHWTP